MNHYECLGLNRDATPHEIRQAYGRLARKYHPDKRQGDDKDDPWPDHIIRTVNDAYNIVSDPDSRKKYDAELDGSANPLPPIDPPRREPYRAEPVPPPATPWPNVPPPQPPADDIWNDVKEIGAAALDSFIEKGLERFTGKRKRRR